VRVDLLNVKRGSDHCNKAQRYVSAMGKITVEVIEDVLT
jgi:hypothetical protein